LTFSRETILILDYGAQYTQLIARRCREEGVFSWIESWDFPLDQIRAMAPVGIILSGGPNSVYDKGAPVRWRDLAGLEIPVLGICYGLQVMMKEEGGSVEAAVRREYGRAVVDVVAPGRLLEGLSPKEPVWMSHGDHATQLPEGWFVTARSDAGVIAGIEHRKKPLFGVQFHPEVSHTPSGDRIIRNFLRNICGARASWTMASYLREAEDSAGAFLESAKGLCALSGGVDSTVVATLAARVAPDRVECVFVDTGLLRKNEAAQVEALFRPRFGNHLHIITAGRDFLADLKGVLDPEVKRRLIGHRFVEVFKREASRFGGVRYLLQGTIYPDVIESASAKGPAVVIKTHHNVGGLPEELGFDLIEPLRYLFKDEVRQLGREMGLPEAILMRHPFPGPGLAVRILGEVTGEAVSLLQEADAIFIEELREEDLYDRVSQAFAVLLTDRTVGVMGDSRTYERILALRSVNTRDFMTADFSPLPFDFLARVASRIANQVRGVNRVVYDITSKPPATVEWQ